ncbi:hypothetical protein AQS70_22445 [Pseudomonas endophytica]|uniref:Uncharacterized protein n=1 Tax=Pseudomonas endophytica TaxID=1563157 RepID=A0A0N8VST5_9PSED|nr:hypothetical protein [Pseudomonas endophytica]KQB54220.1 hypothetical protein AQS70_22445 [Pseudomonas endophytica]
MSPLEAVQPPTRPDVWASHAPLCAVRFHIQAEAEADVLCRVLNVFALQQLIPQQVDVMRDDDSFSIEIVSDEQSWHRAQVIGEKLRNLVSVFDLTLEPAQPARAALTG